MKNKILINFYSLSVYTFSGFILTFPLSVTISQSLAILSSIFFLIDSYNRKQLFKRLRNPFFLASTFIYLALLISFFANIRNYEKPIQALLKGELSDFWMCFVLLTGHYLSRNEKNLRIFSKSFFISAIITLITGLISILTPFRLAIFLQNFFQIPENSRMQHYAGELFGMSTYLPIGLMNTHLTFGGILGIIFVGLVANFFYKIQTRPFYRNLLHSIIIFLYGFVLFYNQSRSVWVGILVCLFLLGFRFFRTWKKVFNKERFAILIPVVILAFALSSYIFQKNWLIQRAFKESLRDTTTENQRFYIYRNTLPVIFQNPIFGVGVGNFYKAHLEESQKLAAKHEELWYDLSVTPRGHAHNDPLHFWTVGGIISLFAFLYFWYYAFRFFYEMEVKGTELLFSGFMLLYPAGFFQCYFLDDEVVLPFFAFLGVFSGRVYEIRERIREKQEIFKLLQERKYQAGHTFQEENITFRNTLENFSKWFQKIINIEDEKNIILHSTRYALATIIIPFLFSLLYIGNLIFKNPENIFQRKVKASSFQEKQIILNAIQGKSKLPRTIAEKGFKLEGCLTHRFGNPPSIRKEPFKMTLTANENVINDIASVVIQRIRRDSFDQDKLYKAHEEIPIDTKEFPIDFGTNQFEFPNLENVLESKGIPENIYFIDYYFQFKLKNPLLEEVNIPIIHINKLCD